MSRNRFGRKKRGKNLVDPQELERDTYLEESKLQLPKTEKDSMYYVEAGVERN